MARSNDLPLSMPIYEYRCANCGTEFEKLVRASDTLKCPSCEGEELHKKLSVFATSSQAAPALPSPCDSCGHPGGPGACALNS
jgi:putative FmdB family regulatory protein